MLSVSLLGAPAGTGETDTAHWIDELVRADRVHAEVARRALVDQGRSALDAVRAALEHAPPAERPNLIDVLGRIGTPFDLQLLQSYLADIDRPIAADALRAMARIDRGSVVRQARQCALSRHWSVRRAAARILARYAPRAGAILGSLLSDPDPSVRQAARDGASARRDAPLVKALTELATRQLSETPPVRDPKAVSWALERLAWLGRDDLAALFARQVASPPAPSLVPVSLAGLLLASPPEAALPVLDPLLGTLTGDGALDRDLVLAALATCREKLADRIVEFLAGHPPDGGEESLLTLLVEAQGPDSLETLVELVERTGTPTLLHKAIVRTLALMPCEATARALLERVWPGADTTLRALVVDTVAAFPRSGPTEKILLLGLEHSSPRTRRRATRTLAATEDPRFEVTLARAVAVESDGELAADMIQAVTLAYGATDPPWARALLEQQMQSRDRDRRLAGLAGIVTVSLGESTPAVIEALWQRFAPQAASDPETCKRLVRVLSRLGGPRAAHHLEELWDALHAAGDVRQLIFLLEQCASMPGENAGRLAWNALRHSAPEVRGAALETLAELRDPALLVAAPEILPRLRPEDRAGFVTRLARYRPSPEVAHLIVEILSGEKNEDVLVAALEVAPQLLEPTLASPLLDVARDAPPGEVRDAALLALGPYGREPVVGDYLRARARLSAPLVTLSEEARHDQRLAALALARTHPQEALPWLVPHLFSGALNDWETLLADSLAERRGRVHGAILDDVVIQTLWQHAESGSEALARHLDHLCARGDIHRLSEDLLVNLAIALRPLEAYHPIVRSLLERVLRIDPAGGDEDFLAAHTLATLAEETGRFTEAAGFYETCLDLVDWGHPSKRTLHDLLGETDGFAGRFYRTLLGAQAALCRALAAAETGDDPRPAFEKACRRAESDVSMLGRIGELALRRGVPPDWVLSLTTRALALLPWEADLLDTHALACALAGRPAEAARAGGRLARMITSGLAHDKGLYHMYAAVRAVCAGDLDRSRREIRQAIRLDASLRTDAVLWKTTEPLRAHAKLWAILEGS